MLLVELWWERLLTLVGQSIVLNHFLKWWVTSYSFLDWFIICININVHWCYACRLVFYWAQPEAVLISMQKLSQRCLLGNGQSFRSGVFLFVGSVLLSRFWESQLRTLPIFLASSNRLHLLMVNNERTVHQTVVQFRQSRTIRFHPPAEPFIHWWHLLLLADSFWNSLLLHSMGLETLWSTIIWIVFSSWTFHVMFRSNTLVQCLVVWHTLALTSSV